MWEDTLRALTDEIPRFNFDMLMDFRTRKIKTIPHVLEELFDQTTRVIANHVGYDKPMLKYKGNRVLPPEERVDMIRKQEKHSRTFSIRKSQSIKMEFIFEFAGNTYTMKVDVPYVDNYAITIEGVNYYPLLTIVERGGLYRSDNQVILQVMRARLAFWREKPVMFTSIEGSSYKAHMILAKLHQSNKGENKGKAPLLLQHLSVHGLEKTLDLFGMKKIISLVRDIKKSSKYEHIMIKDGIYLRILVSGFKRKAKRIVANLLEIYRFHPKFDFDALLDYRYYITVTGGWYYPSANTVALRYENACEFIRMNRTLIDPALQKQHASIGIVYDDLDGLMQFMFDNIDHYIADYHKNSNNLFDKKIGVADQMLSPLISKFNIKLFNEIINSKEGIRPNTVKSLMYEQSYVKWVRESSLFSSSSMFYNDNFLLGMGRSCYRTTANAEMSSNRRGGRMSVSLAKAHHSALAVESISYYPSSKPIDSGSINPFLVIDDDGYIQTPEWEDEIKNVFAK